MKRNKILLLVSSLGVLILLLLAAYGENFRREWRDIQRIAHSEEGAIPVMLRQVVNPALGESDRCVSCHVTMGAGEQSVSGAPLLTAHKPVVHDPAEFGCTVCHGGQGLASEKEAAHGNIEYWPQPMLPASMSYAGCGACHVPLGVPNQVVFRAARESFERLDCFACHRVDGRGGTIRPNGGGMEGPDLSRVGLRGYDQQWYAKHLAKSAEARRAPVDPWKDSFGPVSEGDREQLRAYLAARIGAAPLVEAKAVFHSTGCLGCHKVSGVGGEEGPDLTRAGEKDPGQVNLKAAPGEPTLANWMAEHFRAPGALVTGSQMPPLGLSERDVASLTLYTLSLRRRELPAAYTPRDRMRATGFGEREFANDGATLFGAFCAGCHGLRGQGRKAPGMTAFPSIANPDFLSRVSNAFIRETVARGRPGRRMPAWDSPSGLRPEEIDNVVTYLRALGGAAATVDPKPARWVKADAAAGKRLFESTCASCHGMNGEGGEGPALNNPVLLASATDTYLVETISGGRRGTAMAAFAEPSTVRPTLTAGDVESIVAYLRSLEGDKQ